MIILKFKIFIVSVKDSTAYITQREVKIVKDCYLGVLERYWGIMSKENCLRHKATVFFSF